MSYLLYIINAYLSKTEFLIKQTFLHKLPSLYLSVHLYLLLDFQQFCLDSFILWCYLLSFLKISQCLIIFLLVLSILGLYSTVLWYLLDLFQGPPNNCRLLPANRTSSVCKRRYSAQLKATGCSFALLVFSEAAFEPSTYLKTFVYFLMAISQFWDLKNVFPMFFKSSIN